MFGKAPSIVSTELWLKGGAGRSCRRGVVVVWERRGKLSDSVNLDRLLVAVWQRVKYISSNHVEKAWLPGRMVDLGDGGAVAVE